jgi:hypothetical protein
MLAGIFLVQWKVCFRSREHVLGGACNQLIPHSTSLRAGSSDDNRNCNSQGVTNCEYRGDILVG